MADIKYQDADLSGLKYIKLIYTDLNDESHEIRTEIDYIGNTGHAEQTLAGIYSAKEAVLKALGIGIGRGIDLHDIEIDHDVLGKPFLNMLSENGKKMFSDIGATGVDISISHTKDVSTAICIIKN